MGLIDLFTGHQRRLKALYELHETTDLGYIERATRSAICTYSGHVMGAIILPQLKEDLRVIVREQRRQAKRQS